MTRAPTTAEVLGQMSTDLPEAVSAAVESVEVGVECPETTVEWDGTPTKCSLLAGHAGQHDDGCLTWSTGLSEDSDETEELAKIADLARAHTASIMEWNRAHATTEPSHEDAMAIFERRDRTLFALLDVLHPGWRDVYDAAWGEEGRARRAAARDGVEGQVSP